MAGKDSGGSAVVRKETEKRKELWERAGERRGTEEGREGEESMRRVRAVMCPVWNQGSKGDRGSKI